MEEGKLTGSHHVFFSFLYHLDQSTEVSALVYPSPPLGFNDRAGLANVVSSGFVSSSTVKTNKFFLLE